MNPLTLIAVAIFVACSAAVWVAGQAWLDRRQTLIKDARLASCQPTAEDRGGPAPRGLRLLEYVRPIIPLMRTRTELDERQLKLELAMAGFTVPFASEVYLALQLVAAAAGFLLGTGADLGLRGISITNLPVGLIAAGCGWFAPTLFIGGRQRSRQREIGAALPDALELMAVAIEAGVGPDMALKQVGEELLATAPILSSELEMYQHHLALGRSRRDALHDLGLRCGLADAVAMTNTLIQASRFGTAVAASLDDLASRIRVRLRQKAEERAQKLAFQLIFPLVLFIFPSVFVVLVGPAGILIMRDMLAMG